MKNVYTTSVMQDLIDESPFAYKSIQEIITHTKETIDVLFILKPVYNFKTPEYQSQQRK
ncbi:RtcB family protein [Planococcus versutus]|uniref:RtcB family protein n=1 Tax=Planococcus versutus TaxID=1302659 RepID=UPI0012FF981D|nr:RtcB family protein [Planococcus versutus]